MQPCAQVQAEQGQKHLCLCPAPGSLSVSQMLCCAQALAGLIFCGILFSFHRDPALHLSLSPGSQVPVTFLWCLFTDMMQLSSWENCLADGAVYH